MNIKDELFVVSEALNEAEVDYALCGGMAVVIHGYPRLTRDIDLLLQEVDLERAQKALHERGYTLSSGSMPFDAGKPTERRIVRLTKVEGRDHLTIDMLLVVPFFEDVWHAREQHTVEGKMLQVVSLEGLAKMKRAAARPQDLADLANLGFDEDA